VSLEANPTPSMATQLKRWPSQVWDDTDTLAHVVRCARLHGALAPYRQRLMAVRVWKPHLR
jgi:hypothetical protein